MEVSEINTACKSTMFKSVLKDLIYSYRISLKKLTGATSDIKLDKIRIRPIQSEGQVIVGRIRNLVGGKIACVFDDGMVDFLNNESEYVSDSFSPIEMFAVDFFDCFSSTSKNGLLQLNTNSLEMNSDGWDDSSYYIRFNTKIFTKNGKVIPSKLIISVDEITSMYFRD